MNLREGRAPADSIRGERISSKARKYTRKHDFSRKIDGRTVLMQRYKLEKNAYCVVDVPLTLVGDNATQASNFDAIHGQRISAEARRFQEQSVTMGSSTHQIQCYKLDGHCFCVIDVALLAIADRQRKAEASSEE